MGEQPIPSSFLSSRPISWVWSLSQPPCIRRYSLLMISTRIIGLNNCFHGMGMASSQFKWLWLAPDHRKNMYNWEGEHRSFVVERRSEGWELRRMEKFAYAKERSGKRSTEFYMWSEIVSQVIKRRYVGNYLKISKNMLEWEGEVKWKVLSPSLSLLLSSSILVLLFANNCAKST